jgi:hypothetical protein
MVGPSKKRSSTVITALHFTVVFSTMTITDTINGV